MKDWRREDRDQGQGGDKYTPAPVAGKDTLVEQAYPSAPATNATQTTANAPPTATPEHIPADHGVPQLGTGQRYTIADIFGRNAAHEAAHVVQQRGGVQLKGGIAQPGDAYERHADAVVDTVVAGKSAVSLLGPVPGGHQHAAVQRSPAAPAAPAAGAAGSSPEVTPPKAGIDKPGFIDNSDGAYIRTGPREAGGKTVRDQPLPPATRVFASGTHPDASDWWYVTAYLDNTMVRGYLQAIRVTTDLPEPTAKLHQVVGGDTAEKLAVQQYSSSVRDGHDLRYYENVLLYVNQQRGRAGITGSYQDPGVLGGGSNNVQLVAGHRIWLVSPAYAKALEGVVPDGSLTGGAVAKVKRFAGHLEDILRSVTESRHHFGEVAGEYAQAIRDHMAEIIGIVAGFIMAEATSAFLAATPTGVGQIAAVVIQLALAAFGAAGMVQAGAEMVKHAGEWLTIAWTAKGNDKQIASASKEFLKMLVSIAMAALAYLGVKGNIGNAVKIASSMPTSGLPALAVAGGAQMGGAKAGTGVLTSPGPFGPIGVTGAMMTEHEGEGSEASSSEQAEPSTEPEAATPSAADAESGPAKWVDEKAHMSGNAREYQNTAHGARSNRTTRSSQAPELEYRAADGSAQKVRFDGVEDRVMIDRKKAVTTFPKSERQAMRQSAALQQNGLTAVWEVPTQAEATRAIKMLEKLGISNITTRVVKP